MTARIFPSRLAGTLRVPPSKSMAHRALVCAALAPGESILHNLDYSADITATAGALQLLCASVRRTANGARVAGAPQLPGGKLPLAQSVECGESGSTLRFLIPLFSLAGTPVRFVGAPRLFERPLTVYEDIFAQQHLRFEHTPDGLVVQGPLAAGSYTLRGDVSSQFVSGLLLALPLLEQDSTLRLLPPVESRSYIELTRSAQRHFGVHSHWQNNLTLLVPGGQRYRPAEYTVEGDWSQAVVPAVLGAVRGGVNAAGLSPASPQGDRALLSILGRCGAETTWNGDVLQVRPGGAGLAAPGEVDLADCPDLGPVLTALALFCPGATRFVNAGRLRIKESDRIAAVQAEFTKLGAHITAGPGNYTVQGAPSLLGGQTVHGHNDHRVVMALATAALCAEIPLAIAGAGAVAKSWPAFFDDLAALGAKVETT